MPVTNQHAKPQKHQQKHHHKNEQAKQQTSQQSIRVRVPASTMLMGEHAVLFGEMALACAVDKYIYLCLTPRHDTHIHINSALAQYQGQLSSFHAAAEPRLSFVLHAIQQFLPQLSAGFELSIHSEFSHTVGLGSSAAVTAGTVAALAAFTGASTELADIFAQALTVVHSVQDGRGSGTDLAASIYGAVVAYRPAVTSANKKAYTEKAYIEKLCVQPAICLFYAGYKTKTPDVLKQVEAKAAQQPAIYQQIYRLMGDVTLAAKTALTEQDWAALGQLMNIYHGLLDTLGVADHALCDMVYRLRALETVFGAKISGSGLGDCVLALGNLPKNTSLAAYEKIPLAVSSKGVCFE